MTPEQEQAKAEGTRALAFNLAAQAAAALALGVPVARARFEPSPDGMEIFSALVMFTMKDRAALLVALVGCAAERRVKLRNGPPDAPFSVAALMALSDGERAGLISDALDLLDAHWPSIERVAAALLERHGLDGAELNRLAGHVPLYSVP